MFHDPPRPITIIFRRWNGSSRNSARIASGTHAMTVVRRRIPQYYPYTESMFSARQRFNISNSLESKFLRSDPRGFRWLWGSERGWKWIACHPAGGARRFAAGLKGHPAPARPTAPSSGWAANSASRTAPRSNARSTATGPAAGRRGSTPATHLSRRTHQHARRRPGAASCGRRAERAAGGRARSCPAAPCPASSPAARPHEHYAP